MFLYLFFTYFCILSFFGSAGGVRNGGEMLSGGGSGGSVWGRTRGAGLAGDGREGRGRERRMLSMCERRAIGGAIGKAIGKAIGRAIVGATQCGSEAQKWQALDVWIGF
ncbi:MAG: hypothetical protein LBQ31_00180 [Bacteroidales bacterium]|jgi:hypothetical protein|nr:hypothetical protein [Bacteroidales bacterium]